VSCATCHNPSLGWSDGLRTGVGIHGQVLKRGTPTVANTAFVTQLMWDGRHRTLEEQALGPMRASDEMASDLPAVLERLASMPGYANRFRTAYPAEGVSERAVAKALAAFQRTIVVADSPFDRWLAGDRKALSLQAWRGYQVFVDPKKGNCDVCHAAPAFTDNGFHNIGVRAVGDGDPGRFAVRKVASLRGAFKTPMLRDIERTAPYFRDGSAATLLEVVEHYARGGDERSNLSPNIRPLVLSEQDKADLVVFMRSLTGESASVAVPPLPR
nr:cytochrome c peroxidase [Burkholderiaceae bacterium]